MNKRTYFLLIIPAIVLSWLLATIFIDIMAVPLVFQNVSSRDEAATLGVLIFKRFNNIELTLFFLGSLLIFFSGIFKLKNYLIKFFPLGLFPITYTFFLTDKITHYNKLKMNEIDDTRLEVIQQSLDFYHHLYVRLDMIKIILLTIFFILILKHIKTYINIKLES